MSELFEDLFLRCLGSPERLKEYIANDTDLRAYVGEKYPHFIAIAKLISGHNFNLKQEIEQLNYERILEILKRRRPDLYVVIVPEGLEWLKKQKWNQLLS